MHHSNPLCLLIGVLATLGGLFAAAALWARQVERDARAEDDEWRAGAPWAGG